MKTHDKLTTTQAIKILGISRVTIYTYQKRGLLQSFQLMRWGPHYWNRSEVKALREKMRGNT